MTSPPPDRHVLIVGGGVIGCSTAYYLTHHPQAQAGGVRVTVLEGSSIACGASGKAGGLLAEDWHGTSTASLASLSYKLHADLAAQYDGARRWGYRGLTTLGTSFDLSASPAGPGHDRSRAREKAYEWLDADVLSAPPRVMGTPDTTAQVHPRLFTEALMELAQERGASVLLGTASALEKPSEPSSKPFRVRYVPLEGGEAETIDADDLVLAAGPWTGRLLASFGLGEGSRRAARIDGSRAHSIVLESKEELPAQALFTQIKERDRGKGKKGGWSEPEIYNRPDGTSYACGPTDPLPLPAKASDVQVSHEACQTILSQVRQLSTSHFGEGNASVRAEQACYLPVGSGDEVIGRLKGVHGQAAGGKKGGVYVASGHSCWGITKSAGTGKVMGELILEGSAKSADISQLSP